MKTSVPAIVVLVVAILAGGLLAKNIKAYQDGLTVSRRNLTTLPIAGFHKFVSDVKWMQFIQYCGSQDKVDASNAAQINDRLRFLVSLDPDFVKAYETGALMLAVESPDEAVNLLRLAINNDALRGNWRLPFLAGFIKLRQVRGETAKDKEYLMQAIDFFDVALKRGRGEADYVLGSKLHAKALLNRGDRPVLLAELETWYTYFTDTFAAADMGMGADGKMVPSDGFYLDDGMARDRVAQRILALAQACSTELRDHEKTMAVTKDIMGRMQSEFHLCSSCFHEYQAGDKYCSSCGKDVAMFGACTKCGFITTTAYCSRCGAKGPEEKPALTAVAKPPAPARAARDAKPETP